MQSTFYQRINCDDFDTQRIPYKGGLCKILIDLITVPFISDICMLILRWDRIPQHSPSQHNNQINLMIQEQEARSIKNRR